VSFASEVKHDDGGTAEKDFEDWAKKQQGGRDQFTPAEVAEFLPPNVHPGNLDPRKPHKATQAKFTKGKPKERKPRSDSAASAPQETPSYVAYIQQFHTSREDWKFNKSKQSDLLKNIFNTFRVPPENDMALKVYLVGLQGQALRTPKARIRPVTRLQR